MQLNIYTPNKIIYTGSVDSFTTYTHKGKIGILTNHIPLIADLSCNIFDFSYKGQHTLCLVWGGLFRFINNEATILANNIEFLKDIDIDRAHKSEKRAVALLKMAEENTESEIDVTRSQKSLKRARMRIKCVRM